MDAAALVGVVVGHSVKLVCDFFPCPVSGNGNSGFAFVAGYDFDTAMVDSNAPPSRAVWAVLAAGMVAHYSLFKKGLELFLCQRYRVGDKAFKKPHAAA